MKLVQYVKAAHNDYNPFLLRVHGFKLKVCSIYTYYIETLTANLVLCRPFLWHCGQSGLDDPGPAHLGHGGRLLLIHH